MLMGVTGHFVLYFALMFHVMTVDTIKDTYGAANVIKDIYLHETMVKSAIIGFEFHRCQNKKITEMIHNTGGVN